MTNLWVIIFLFAPTLSFEVPYKKVLNSLDPQAKCLDGSPPALYVNPGTDKKNILIFIVGGGICGTTSLSETIENCYERSKTQLGSSIYWQDEIIGPGYLSTDPSVSRFANWTKIIFTYCDGSLHQGSSKVPFKYKDAILYFRGANIVRSHFQWINNTYSLYNADRVVLTGGSAGGIGTFLWTNYLREMMVNANSVYSIPDSSIFLNKPSWQTNEMVLQGSLQNLFKIANIDEKTPLSSCNQAFPGEEWRCLLFQHAISSVQGKVLLLNSAYDSFQIANFLQIDCVRPIDIGFSITNCTTTQRNQIQAYRKDYQQLLSDFLKSPNHSAWSISCSQHVYGCVSSMWDSELQKVPGRTGLTIRNAVERFVFDNERIVAVDQVEWPQNTLCSQ